MKYLILALILGIIAGVWIERRLHECPVAFRDYTPSPTEAQEYLGVEPDGIIGHETHKAWTKQWLDQTGYETIVEFGGGE